MLHLQFFRAILSRNFIARQSCSMQLCMSHTATLLLHKQALTKLIGHFLFMRQSRSVRHAHFANVMMHFCVLMVVKLL